MSSAPSPPRVPTVAPAAVVVNAIAEGGASLGNVCDPASTQGGRVDRNLEAPDPLIEIAKVMRAVASKVLARAPSDPDVDDVLQDALRRVLESGENERRDLATLRPWAIGVVRHVTLDHLRGHRRRSREVAITDESHGENIADERPDPFDLVSGRGELEMAAALLADLPDEMRRALLLFHVEGLGYKTISQRMGVPLGTVATWVTRGRKLLSTGMLERIGTLPALPDVERSKGGSHGR